VKAYNKFMKHKTVPVMVRIRLHSKELLVRAAKDQRRSQASVVDTMIVDTLSRQYSTTDDRLNSMLKVRDANTDNS
jgi:hypothetical protein